MKRRAFLLLAAALLLVSACSGEPRAVQRVAPGAIAIPSRPVLIHVVSHGWHTGIVVPADALERPIPDLRERFGGTAASYEIGWGDKGFYPAREVTPGLALRALFASEGAVMHVSAVPGPPQASFPASEVVPLCVSSGGFDDLREFIAASFARDPAHHLVPLSKGIYGDSQFYEAVGRYSVAHTCNTWTAKGLLSAGVDLDPWLKLTARSVMRALEHQDRALGCTVAPDPDALPQNAPPA